MIAFRLVPHHVRAGETVVEVLKDGEVCGALYTDGESGVKLVSAHFAGDVEVGNFFPSGIRMDNGGGAIPIPSVHIQFDPRTYALCNGKLLRPTIHIMWNAMPLCGFSGAAPKNWPHGDTWVSPRNADVATCTRCKTQLSTVPESERA